MSIPIEFYKYHGTGNDFVLIDNRSLNFPKTKNIIAGLCDRRFGIGADGLILLEDDAQQDFRMVYYNSDGNESTMCGNGGRCLVAFAHYLGIIKDRCTFIAVDGLHEAEIENAVIRLKMADVPLVRNVEKDFELNTGSPHYVRFTENLSSLNVFEEGNKIRNSASYCNEGINVNFAEKISEDELFVRTYERGVEDETFSCGTGATACALVFLKDSMHTSVRIKVLGGSLRVSAEKQDTGFKNIWLEGPATQVFKGIINV